VLVDGVPVGLGLALVAIATAVAVGSAAGREGWQSAKGHRWLLVVAGLLFSCGALQDAGWLTTLEVCAGAVFAALAIDGWTGEAPLSQLSPWKLLVTPAVVGLSSARVGAVLSAREARTALGGSTVTRRLPDALRMLAIVLPPVLLVTALLAWGDALFGARVSRGIDALVDFPLASVLRGAVVSLAAGVMVAGLIALAARRRGKGPAPAVPRRSIKPVEAFALLGTLSALLLGFGATSWGCAFSPDSCALPPGVTYAEAAHEGFFQLLAAALVILALLMTLPHHTALAGPAQERTFRLLASLLVLATWPMVLSGIARLARYEDAYGLTRLRIMAHAGLILVGVVMSWRALTLWAAPQSFVPGALASVAASLFALTALRPDALIARHNLLHPNTVDVAYLAELSDDAAGAIVEALPSMDDDRQRALRLHLHERATARGASADLGAWNLGRFLADRAVAALEGSGASGR
jgi:hypothetical protein